MQEAVQAYIEKEKAAQAERALEEKNNLLLSLGLTRKEYASPDQSSAEYQYSEWDPQTKEERFYRIAPIEVSDEEYREILKYQEARVGSSKNAIANIFKVLAWVVFICGFIAGFIFGMNSELGSLLSDHSRYEFSITVALIYWISSFISGMMFLGFAEIIQLLTDIRNK